DVLIAVVVIVQEGASAADRLQEEVAFVPAVGMMEGDARTRGVVLEQAGAQGLLCGLQGGSGCHWGALTAGQAEQSHQAAQEPHGRVLRERHGESPSAVGWHGANVRTVYRLLRDKSTISGKSVFGAGGEIAFEGLIVRRVGRQARVVD